MRRKSESGYALLLVFLMAAGIAISLYIEIPRVAFESQRQKEQLLVSRGEQYKRAIFMFVKTNNRWPAKIEELESFNNRRFLRKRFTDPMTGREEWRFIHIANGILQDSVTNKQKTGAEAPGGSASQLVGEVPASAGDITPGSQQIANLAQRRRASDSATPGAGGSGDGQPFDPNNPNNQQVPGMPNGQVQPGQINPATGQPYTGINPQTGQPYPTGINPQTGQPYPTGINPQTGQPFTGINPQTGQPYPTGINPQTGQPYPGAINPLNGQPYPNAVNPQTGQPYVPGINPQTGQPYPTAINPQTGQAYPPGFVPPTGVPIPGQANYGGQPQYPGQPVQYPGLTVPGSPQFPGQPVNSQFQGASPYPTYPGAAGQQPGFPQPGMTAQPGSNQATQMIQQILTSPRPGGMPTGAAGTIMGAGIAGVASNADSESIMVYNDRTNYKEWEFIHDPLKVKPIPNPLSGSPGTPANQLGSTPGTSPGSLGSTPGGFGSTPGGLGSTPGGFGSTPGGFGSTPGMGRPATIPR
jgi:hypothetical protein